MLDDVEVVCALAGCGEKAERREGAGLQRGAGAHVASECDNARAVDAQPTRDRQVWTRWVLPKLGTSHTGGTNG